MVGRAILNSDGIDVLIGKKGDDRLWAADGVKDRLYGGNGTDRAIVDKGIDRVRGVESIRSR